MTPRLPKHRIPKIKVECIACAGTNVTTVMSQAFSAGYHRRHICNECDAPFYSLALYDKSSYDVQSRPFKDRALTPWELQQRLEWEAEGNRVTLEVPSPFATEFIETINIAFQRYDKGEMLTAKDDELMNAIIELERNYNDE